MAEEAQYSSGNDSSAPLKRKYDDQPSAAPATGIELAKQRAQEVAARLLSVAPPPPSTPTSVPSPIPASIPSMPSLSTLQFLLSPMLTKEPARRLIFPTVGLVSLLEKLERPLSKYLQLQSGAKIQVTRDMDADPNSPTRMVELMGTPEAIASAEKLINEVLAEAESGGSGIVARRLTGQSGSDEFSMKIPNNKVGLIIGKGGETIKNMQASTGARIQVIPLHLPPGDTSTERTLKIDGTPEQIESAKQLVNQVISGENRLRNPAISGGYPQQGYQSRPPSNWAPPSQMQQPGYGYVQPGAYSGPSHQYNMPQPPYAGYPPQQPGGYSTNWDQSTVPPHQQSAHTGGYDYYSQQPQQTQNPGGPAPPADGSAYNYSQAPSSGYNQPGPGYAQDGYNAYSAQTQSGYGQPQTYDQQQGYGSATGGYGSGSNPSQEGHTASFYASQGDSVQASSGQPTAIAQQGYPAGQQPGSNTATYPPQGTPQAGYGVPPTSQEAYGNQPQPGFGPGYGPPQSQKPSSTPPPVYGGQSQSPSAGGYSQSAYPAQPPPSGYAQTESRAPPSGYGGAVQPGYAPQTYGAPLKVMDRHRLHTTTVLMVLLVILRLQHILVMVMPAGMLRLLRMPLLKLRLRVDTFAPSHGL
ncbi:hypothetical protein Fmac_000531 [Flemingia macrophylla]|uniref:K Homology domain-containing protein n=1 Tax=Flemingia macrophylla TaxID=520843 RepID=A0ABD1NEZ9_9FABA